MSVRYQEAYQMSKAYFHSCLAAAVLGAVIAVSLPAQAKDAAAGQAVFKSQCSICHSPSLGKNNVGPSLFGVVGRHTASVAGFHYSAGNQAADLTWSEATLEKYIDSPKAIVPGTTMSFAGIKDAEKRADLIAYLSTLK
jgi:cytochrome c